jgi:hypothetical protein
MLVNRRLATGGPSRALEAAPSPATGVPHDMQNRASGDSSAPQARQVGAVTG